MPFIDLVVLWRKLDQLRCSGHDSNHLLSLSCRLSQHTMWTTATPTRNSALVWRPTASSVIETFASPVESRTAHQLGVIDDREPVLVGG